MFWHYIIAKNLLWIFLILLWNKTSRTFAASPCHVVWIYISEQKLPTIQNHRHTCLTSNCSMLANLLQNINFTFQVFESVRDLNNQLLTRMTRMLVINNIEDLPKLTWFKWSRYHVFIQKDLVFQSLLKLQAFAVDVFYSFLSFLIGSLWRHMKVLALINLSLMDIHFYIWIHGGILNLDRSWTTCLRQAMCLT